MRHRLTLLSVLWLSAFLSFAQPKSADVPSAPGRWPATKANAWYAKEPFLFGGNYNPANAINELEFW
ncbi:MAG: hypothetical protein EOO39_15615, partial [Cytophagaceae bacterium]